VTVPQGDGCAAIAFYALTKLNPDPCQSILDKIKKFGPLPPNDPMPAALKALYTELVGCQAANGEPQTPPTRT